MFPQKTNEYAEQIIKEATVKCMTIATAESCTGGLIIGALTEITGSSAVVDRGFITYTNAAKVEMLGVKAQTLDKFGAVSEETVKEMALGALKNAGVDIAVSVSGIAGPTGGSAEKPVGLVHWALASKNGVICDSAIFKGNRSAVREQTVETVLGLILKNIK